MGSRPRDGGVRGTGASQGRWQCVRGGTVRLERRRPLVAPGDQGSPRAKGLG